MNLLNLSPFVKLEIFAPMYLEKRIREILSQTGAGRIGKFSGCSFSTIGKEYYQHEDFPRGHEEQQVKLECTCLTKNLPIVMEQLKKDVNLLFYHVIPLCTPIAHL